MKTFLQTIIFLFISHYAVAQNITLIQDANPGTNGSVRGMSAELNGDIYYIGFKSGQFGNQLFKYDAEAENIKSISPVLQSSKNLLIASLSNIYLSDGNIVYRLRQEDNNFIKVFENGPVSEEFETFVVKDETIVALSESANGNWKVHLINESSGVEIKVNTGFIDDEVAATIGNKYIAIRPTNSFGDLEKGNFLIDKSTGNVLAPSDVFEDGPPCAYINMFAIGDYILFDCNNGYRYIYSTTQKTYIQLPEFVKDVRENEDYVFIHANQKLYSFYKATSNLVDLGSGIRHIGEVDDVDGTLYFLKSSQDKLFSTDGTMENTQTYTIEGEINSNSEVLNVTRIGDSPIVAYNENVRDFWILKINGSETESITGKIKLGSNFLPFINLMDKLIFSYNHPEYGEELFIADFEPTATKNENNLQRNVVLYPNPAGEMLNVKFEYIILESRAIDVYGRSHSLEVTEDSRIDINSLFPGIYILHLKVADSNSVIIKQFYKL